MRGNNENMSQVSLYRERDMNRNHLEKETGIYTEVRNMSICNENSTSVCIKRGLLSELFSKWKSHTSKRGECLVFLGSQQFHFI
jgi:hypothetical protein